LNNFRELFICCVTPPTCNQKLLFVSETTHTDASLTFPMATNLLASCDASKRLGIGTPTLYDWLSQSDAGEFVLRGQSTTIHYFQGGRKGQGRIKIAESEVNRLLSLMTVTPRAVKTRKPTPSRRSLQHITAILGRPDD
jgi:hypothetical protein